MQVSVSSTLTVYHDGQFWVGLAEHVEDGRYGAARIVFGAEPPDEDQGTTGARGTAGSDEAGVGSSKKPASRG